MTEVAALVGGVSPFDRRKSIRSALKHSQRVMGGSVSSPSLLPPLGGFGQHLRDLRLYIR